MLQHDNLYFATIYVFANNKLLLFSSFIVLIFDNITSKYAS